MLSPPQPPSPCPRERKKSKISRRGSNNFRRFCARSRPETLVWRLPRAHANFCQEMPLTEAQYEQWLAPVCTLGLHGLVVLQFLTCASPLYLSMFSDKRDEFYALSFFGLLALTLVAYKLVYSSHPGYVTISRREGELLLKDGFSSLKKKEKTQISRTFCF